MTTIRYRKFDDVGRALLRTVSYCIVPIAIAAISIIAILFWRSAYHGVAENAIALRVVQTAEELTLEEARARTTQVDPVYSYDTRLSADPVWFAFQLDANDWQHFAVEVPSRHVVELSCWNAQSLERIGTGKKAYSLGALAPLKAGYVLAPSASLSNVLCRGIFEGPAKLTALLWSTEKLANSDEHFHRKSGLMEGGMIGLALFALVIGILNREKLYLLFSGWLFLNWRVGALSAGWDVQWLGQSVPEKWLLPMRALSMVLYGLVTFELFFTLFREYLEKSRLAFALKVTSWLGLLLLVAAALLPYGAFLPLLWITASAMFGLMIVSSVNILVTSRSRVAFWYVASFFVTFVSTLSEVIAAALGVREFVGVVNSVTAALASSLLAMIAIAEQVRLEHAQRLEAQAQLEHTYAVIPMGLFTADTSGRLLSVNPALAQRLGISMAQAEWDNALMHYFEAGAWATFCDRIHQEGTVEQEMRSRDGGGHFLVKGTLSHRRIEGFIQDITEKVKATSDLLFMVNHDPLTRVFNRRGLEAVFANAAAACQDGGTMAFAYLDLDRFKLINELYGHSAGDELLLQVCERIIPRLAVNHHIGRVGGDEFVLVMPETAISLAESICREIVEVVGDSPFQVGDKAFHVRSSIGLVEIRAGMTMKEAVTAADQACREAKNRHGEGLVVYEGNADALRTRQAEMELIECLAHEDATAHLFLEMQPIMAFKNPHDSLNFEVLLRMRGSNGGVIPAGRVIAAAEKSAMTGKIDRWVLNTVLKWIEENLLRLGKTQFVTMNLSGASLNDERFIQDTLAILDNYPVGAQLLCMEITESVALHDLDNTRRFINQVRACGVRVALDDFGAGYTSFSYLKDLPADVLKIDGQFVLNINEHPANVAIVEAIVSLARNLGMQTIAEWAEDAATARTLAEIGVDYLQGFVVARSQPPEKILAAESAVSFITDEQMLRMVKLREADSAAADGYYADLFFFKGMH